VKVDGLQFKVAATADGRTVLAMPDKLSPSRRDFEVVYDKLEALARSSGAAVLKLEAVAAGPSVMGFVFTVDRDLYAELKARSLTK
jgi:hypothetical protein